jgi:hypothetical protein
MHKNIKNVEVVERKDTTFTKGFDYILLMEEHNRFVCTAES